jgi:hypothetical protein
VNTQRSARESSGGLEAGWPRTAGERQTPRDVGLIERVETAYRTEGWVRQAQGECTRLESEELVVTFGCVAAVLGVKKALLIGGAAITATV